MGGEGLKKYTFSVLIEKDEDSGFFAKVPELKGCHTQGETIAELLANIQEAIALCLEVHNKDGINMFNQNYFQTQTIEMVV